MSGFSIMILAALAAGAIVVLLAMPAAREARSRKNLHRHPSQ